MVTFYVLDDQGEAVEATIEQWGATDRASQVVQQDRIGDILVSTALIGIDHGTGAWETMIFDNGNPVSRRPTYTKADALDYHQAAVAALTSPK